MFKLTEEVIKEICQKYRIDIVENGNGEII